MVFLAFFLLWSQVESLHQSVELIDFGLGQVVFGLDTTAGEDWSRNQDSFISDIPSASLFKGLGDVLVLMDEGVGRSFDWSVGLSVALHGGGRLRLKVAAERKL